MLLCFVIALCMLLLCMSWFVYVLCRATLEPVNAAAGTEAVQELVSEQQEQSGKHGS